MRGMGPRPMVHVALRAQYVIGILVVASFNLPIGQERANAVRVNVIHLEVVVDVAAFRRNLASAHRHATHRRLIFHRPRNLIGAVNRLFHHAVARTTTKSYTSYESAIRCRLFPQAGVSRWHGFYRTCVVSRIVSDQVADRALVYLVEGGHNLVRITPAETRHDIQIAFASPSCTVSSTWRTPGASVAIGFSQKTCLLASIAARRCVGRKPGGVASSTTSTPLSISPGMRAAR